MELTHISQYLPSQVLALGNLAYFGYPDCFAKSVVDVREMLLEAGDVCSIAVPVHCESVEFTPVASREELLHPGNPVGAVANSG